MNDLIFAFIAGVCVAQRLLFLPQGVLFKWTESAKKKDWERFAAGALHGQVGSTFLGSRGLHSNLYSKSGWRNFKYKSSMKEGLLFKEQVLTTKHFLGRGILFFCDWMENFCFSFFPNFLYILIIITRQRFFLFF